MIQDLGDQMENKCSTLALKLLVISAQCLWGGSPTEFHNTSKASLQCLFPDDTGSPGSDFTTLLMFLTWSLAFWLTLNLSLSSPSLPKKRGFADWSAYVKGNRQYVLNAETGEFYSGTVKLLPWALWGMLHSSQLITTVIFFFFFLMGNEFLQYPI